jgi:hypothetical protein
MTCLTEIAEYRASVEPKDCNNLTAHTDLRILLRQPSEQGGNTLCGAAKGEHQLRQKYHAFRDASTGNSKIKGNRSKGKTDLP